MVRCSYIYIYVQSLFIIFDIPIDISLLRLTSLGLSLSLFPCVWVVHHFFFFSFSIALRKRGEKKNKRDKYIVERRGKRKKKWCDSLLIPHQSRTFFLFFFPLFRFSLSLTTHGTSPCVSMLYNFFFFTLCDLGFLKKEGYWWARLIEMLLNPFEKKKRFSVPFFIFIFWFVWCVDLIASLVWMRESFYFLLVPFVTCKCIDR